MHALVHNELCISRRWSTSMHKIRHLNELPDHCHYNKYISHRALVMICRACYDIPQSNNSSPSIIRQNMYLLNDIPHMYVCICQSFDIIIWFHNLYTNNHKESTKCQWSTKWKFAIKSMLTYHKMIIFSSKFEVSAYIIWNDIPPCYDVPSLVTLYNRTSIFLTWLWKFVISRYGALSKLETCSLERQ